MNRITPSIIVCALAASFAAMALLVNANAAVPARVAAAPPSPVPGYGSTAAPAATISMTDLSFSDPVTVKAGGQVTVDNQDGVAHTLTATDGSFDTGALAAGARTTFVAPNTPGTYVYACTIHPQMTGQLTVGP